MSGRTACYDATAKEANLYAIKKGALGYVMQQTPTIELQRPSLLFATDIIASDMGIDCGEGVGQDYHVITILNQDLKECFQLRSNKIAPYEVAKCAYMLGKIYNNALIVVEKASGGNVVLDKLVHVWIFQQTF